jgi:hypothetical protein
MVIKGRTPFNIMQQWKYLQRLARQLKRLVKNKHVLCNKKTNYAQAFFFHNHMT